MGMSYDYTAFKHEKRFILATPFVIVWALSLEILKNILLTPYWLVVNKSGYSRKISGVNFDGVYLLIPYSRLARKYSYSSQAVGYRSSKIVLANWFDLNSIYDLKAPKNASTEFHLFERIDKDYSTITVHKNFINIKKNSCIGELDFSLPIEKIQVNTNFDGNHKIKFVFLIQEYFDKWKSEEFFVQLNSQIGKGIDRIITQFEGKDKYCAIVVPFSNENYRFRLGEIVEYGFSKIVSAITANMAHLNNTFGYKVIMPDFLRTPISQYLSFFDDYVINSKGIKIGFTISKIEDGVLIQVLPNQRTDVNEIKKWFMEYVNIVRDVTYFTRLDGVSLSTEKPLIDEYLLHQIDSLKKSIQILESAKNGILKNGNKPINFISNSENGINDKVLYFFEREANLKPTTKELKISIENGYIASVINELRLFNLPLELSNEVSLILSRMNELNSKLNRGIISMEEESLEKNRITNSLINLIDRVEDSSQNR